MKSTDREAIWRFCWGRRYRLARNSFYDIKMWKQIYDLNMMFEFKSKRLPEKSAAFVWRRTATEFWKCLKTRWSVFVCKYFESMYKVTCDSFKVKFLCSYYIMRIKKFSSDWLFIVMAFGFVIDSKSAWKENRTKNGQYVLKLTLLDWLVRYVMYNVLYFHCNSIWSNKKKPKSNESVNRGGACFLHQLFEIDNINTWSFLYE